MKMKSLLSIMALFLAMACLSHSAPDIRLFPFSKDVSQPEGVAKNVAAFQLDEEVLARTVDGYANMRLLDADKKEKPFLVRTAKTKTKVIDQVKIKAEADGFKALPDNKVEMIYSIKKEVKDLPAVLVFVSALKDFEKQVTVWGGNGDEAWELLAENQPIFDYSRFIDVRNSRVEIKPGKYARYKIMLSNITESQQSPLVSIARETRNGVLESEIENSSFKREDFRIERLDFFAKNESVVRSKVLTRDYPVLNLAVTNDTKEKLTILTFDTGRAPLTSLTLISGSSNFSRQLRVESSQEEAGDNAWNHVMSSSISRIDAGGFKQDHTKVALGRVDRSRRMRIVISNRDSPALAVSAVKAEGEIHEALFFPETSSSFSVMYGADGLSAPVYDIADVLAKVDGADATQLSLGPQKENPQYDASARLPSEGGSLLVVAVVLMVLGLGWIILKTVKKLDTPE